MSSHRIFAILCTLYCGTLATRSILGNKEINLMGECRKIEDDNFKEDCKSIAKLYLKNSNAINEAIGLAQIQLKRPQRCPSFFAVRQASAPNLKSLSPWTYVMNFNRTRFPMIIHEAKCLCEGCINVQTGEEDLTLYSKEIFVEIPSIVPMRSDIAITKCTRSTCTTEIVKVAVACYCAV